MFPGYTNFCACATKLSAREDDPWFDSQPAVADYNVAEYSWQDGLPENASCNDSGLPVLLRSGSARSVDHEAFDVLCDGRGGNTHCATELLDAGSYRGRLLFTSLFDEVKTVAAWRGVWEPLHPEKLAMLFSKTSDLQTVEEDLTESCGVRACIPDELGLRVGAKENVLDAWKHCMKVDAFLYTVRKLSWIWCAAVVTWRSLSEP